MKRCLRLQLFPPLAAIVLLAWCWTEWPSVKTMTAAKRVTPALAEDGPGLFKLYCAGCHSNGRAKVDLDGRMDSRLPPRDRSTWKKVARMLRTQEMPPEGQPRPSSEERDSLIHWVEQRMVAESRNPPRRGRLPGGRPHRSANGQFALASRLAVFLWKSVPDAELLAQARRGVLRHNLAGQVQRMLKDSRARHFAAGFADSWLKLRRLYIVPGVDAPLLAAMRQETERFVEYIIREDRSVLEFLDADYTFLNERLARHYGIAGVRGDELRRVPVPGTPRGGLLTQATILMLTSRGEQTSPVHRGKWVLDNLLDTPPPAPPTGLLNALKQTRKAFEPGTVRQLLEQHRAHPSCAHCHSKIDGLGFALENFDAIGHWRTQDNHRPLDASATLPSGESFNGPVELKAYLRGKKELFIRCLSGKLLSYALGRSLEDSDRAALAHVPERAAATQHRFGSVVVQVVKSDPFQTGFDQPEE
jgi:mono/diheme cytochrome c family protein